MIVLETERLLLRHLELSDAEFIIGLLNEPSFLEFIGDKGVRTLEDAHRYINDGPRASYDRHGFGLYLVELKSTGDGLGICGMVKRDTLDDADIGFAFLPPAWGRGYAYEAAAAVIKFETIAHRLPRILAITQPDNTSSIRLLEKLGLRFRQTLRFDPDGKDISLYSYEVQSAT